MTNQVANNQTEIHNLSSILLSTLDESLFFNQLCLYMHDLIKADTTKVYLVKVDSSAKLMSKNGKISKTNQEIGKGIGASGHVIKTRRPYFSNNVSRDPLFASDNVDGVRAELIMPVSHEGIVISTIHFIFNDGGEREFSKEDLVKIQSILSELKTPLANMKMYLSAKHLNESLVKQIEQKEKKLKDRQSGLSLSSAFKVEEKEVIGRSDKMKKTLELADKISQIDVNALIFGEKGCGKELLARRIHCRSLRSGGSFISLDCSTFAEERLEAEIFGQEAIELNGMRLKSGLIELANGGTLVLSNIHLLNANMQLKLNRFLREGVALRLGGQAPYRSEVRVIATTPENIAQKVEDGLYSEELYYALNTVILTMPALKERLDDIEFLATYFLNLNRSKEEHKSLSPNVISILKDYSWPGNVRELQNIIERAYILSDGMIIEKEHISECITNSEKAIETCEALELSFQEMTLDELEKRHIVMTLGHLNGNKTRTARMLGITVKTLYNKLHSYDMIQAKEA